MTDSGPAAPLLAQVPLLVVRWKHPDGSVSSGCPLPRPYAEALARAFAQIYPRQSYWLEAVPWLVAPGRRRVAPKTD